MNDREVSELRRHLRPDRQCISAIHGCYVTGSGETMAHFTLPMSQLSDDDREKYLELLKKTISGSINRSLTDVTFTTQQVMDSDEHRLLMRLRSSELGDEAALHELYEKIAACVRMEENYLILCACDRYDVPRRARDGATLEDSEEVFSYLLCSVCPVKQGKTALHYEPEERDFRAHAGQWTVAAPQLGFLFPAFDSRRANIYGALYYCRNPRDSYPDFVQALFRTEPPMPVQTQKETFASLLCHTLEDECSLTVVQTVQEQMSELLEAHRQSHEAEPLTVSGGQVQSLLRQCGVSDARTQTFAKQCEAAFGQDAVLSPRNLIDPQLRLRTPDVVINVSAGRSDLLQTRTIGGVNYILVCADEGVEVNGVDIRFSDEKKA